MALLLEPFCPDDVTTTVTKRCRAYDVKMFMDTCKRARFDVAIQKELFKRAASSSAKVKDRKVSENLYLNLGISYDADERERLGFTHVPLLFLSKESSAVQSSANANSDDLIYRNPVLFDP